MVRQEQNRRGPEPGGNPPEPRHLAAGPDELVAQAPTEARRQAARKIFDHQSRLGEKTEKVLVRPEFRERVEQLMRDQWREPVLVLRLGDDDPGYDVPGRRSDGTVKGRKLIRRFFWNVLRGVGGAAFAVFAFANGAGSGGGKWGKPFQREIRVTGPANAMALDLLDKLRPTSGPWLVLSPSRLAVVDTGSTFLDPAGAPPPRIVWQARKPEAPEINLRTRVMTWPDGSKFRFTLHGRDDEQRLRKYHESPEAIHWNR